MVRPDTTILARWCSAGCHGSSSMIAVRSTGLITSSRNKGAGPGSTGSERCEATYGSSSEKSGSSAWIPRYRPNMRGRPGLA